MCTIDNIVNKITTVLPKYQATIDLMKNEGYQMVSISENHRVRNQLQTEPEYFNKWLTASKNNPWSTNLSFRRAAIPIILFSNEI